MPAQKPPKILIILAFILFSLPAFGSDEAKEKRWAEQIVDSLLVGEAVWLPVDKRQFLAIHAESTAAKTQGAAIILHGIGAHPDWPEVINPLRSELPEYGWATLSLQMPILPNDARAADYVPLLDEVSPRIDAAIAYLNKQGIRNIVLIAHSLGTAMASYYLASNPDSPIRAYVGISMIEDTDDTALSNVAYLTRLKLPVLDIYGYRDLDSVTKNAKARRQAAAMAKNKRYRQVVIEDADHFYTGKEGKLIKRIRGWLRKNAAGMEIGTGR